MFLDMTIHDFDKARYLSGREVVEVYAAAGVMVDPGIGAIDNCRKAVHGYDQRIEAFCCEYDGHDAMDK